MPPWLASQVRNCIAQKFEVHTSTYQPTLESVGLEKLLEVLGHGACAGEPEAPRLTPIAEQDDRPRAALMMRVEYQLVDEVLTDRLLLALDVAAEARPLVRFCEKPPHLSRVLEVAPESPAEAGEVHRLEGGRAGVRVERLPDVPDILPLVLDVVLHEDMALDASVHETELEQRAKSTRMIEVNRLTWL